MAFADTQKLVVELDLAGNLNAKLGQAARALQGFNKSTSNTQQSLSKFGRNLERGIAIGAAAAAGGFVAVAKAAGDFEAQLNTIATIVDRKEIPKIGADLRKTARDTGLSLDDLTSAYYDLASAGVKGQLATDALNDAVKLGIGGLATTAETVDLLTTAINAYGLDSKGAAKATDQFAQAVADGKVKASEIAATFANVASIAKASGIGIDQIATSYAFLTAQGVPAAEVTTEMQRAIISLIKPTGDLETAQKKLKVSFAEEIQKKGLVPALQELRDYSDKTGTPLISLLGRIEAVKYVLQTTGPNLKGYNAELAKMGQVSGVAAAQMAERQQGLNFQLAKLKAGLHDAAITIGSDLLPKLTPLIAKFNDFLNGHQGDIQDFGTKLADGFEKFTTALGKVDWQPFIDGLKLSAQIAEKAFAIFRSLPEGLQAALVGGFALNKLTGGLGTSIVKDIGGQVLQNFAARGSSPANPLWVAQVGGLGGLGGAAAEAAGGAATVGSAGLAVAAGALALAASPIIIAGVIQAQHKAGDPVRTGGSRGFFPGFSAANTQPGTNLSFGTGTNSGVGKALDDVALATTLNAQRLQDIKDADLSIVTATTKVGSILDALHQSFKTDLAALIHATKAADIAKAAKAVAKEIAHGVGSVGTTKNVLGDLRKQLANTHDPKLQAVLKAAIDQVNRRLPGREFASKELSLANQTLASHRSMTRKITDLQAIERALKDHGLPHAAAQIQTKIDNAKRAQVAASYATARAIEDKKLAVTTNVTLNTSIRDTINGVTKLGRYSSVATTVSKGVS